MPEEKKQKNKKHKTYTDKCKNMIKSLGDHFTTILFLIARYMIN